MRRRPHIIPVIIACVMLLGAIAENPYGYYMVLRVVVCATSLLVLYVGVQSEKSWAVWTYGVTALLFNPFLRVHLTRQIWALLDLGAAGLLFASIFVLALPTPEPTDSQGNAS